MRNVRSICAALALALVACAGAAEPGPETTTPPPSGEPTAEPGVSGGGGPGAAVSSPVASSPPSGAAPGPFVCSLPAPVKSDDACTKDADCAPSVPCHARACVAASRAEPRKPDTVCSMMADCQSADVNPCMCYEGRCALVPKAN
ncbi:hypothetical protein [Polyangium mundeleinium]|uniref:Uncharacterized protein n=1 Tax=Polyangium mundeleinium TaxID=2995306 RepID=A0ABT5F2E7_9BACT|nr:hypothetical protein [Polyangium mundeleinium]MDC0748258.1 hypothetical protein [Polyangium mundeleinium]